jgi:hypothetical protein
MSTVRARPRPGFTMVEVTLSVFLLAIAMTTTVQIAGTMARERRSVERRSWALHEVANLMERLTAKPWDELTSDSARDASRSLVEAIRRKLPGGELSIAVEETHDGIAEKRVAIQLRWRDRVGVWERPVRLNAWIARPGTRLGITSRFEGTLTGAHPDRLLGATGRTRPVSPGGSRLARYAPLERTGRVRPVAPVSVAIPSLISGSDR